MKAKLEWTNGLIFNNEIPIGGFGKNKMLSCEYSLNEKEVLFEQIDLGKKRIAIMDKNRKRLGMIYRSRWSKAAKIELIDNTEFEIKPAGFFSSKWKVFAQKNELMEFTRNIFSKGEIKFAFQDELLILAGLYVLND